MLFVFEHSVVFSFAIFSFFFPLLCYLILVLYDNLKKLIMVLLDVRLYRLFVYNRFIVIFNIYQFKGNCVFCVTFAICGFAFDVN